VSKEFYGFDDDDFKIEGETHMKPWQPITWANRRPDHLAWREVDDAQGGIEVLAYNYSFGENLQAFYLERAPSIAVTEAKPERDAMKTQTFNALAFALLAFPGGDLKEADKYARRRLYARDETNECPHGVSYDTDCEQCEEGEDECLNKPKP